MMQKNLIFSFSYFATVGKYTENPYGRKRQERDSDLYDISAEQKNERQQNVFVIVVRYLYPEEWTLLRE